MSSTSVEHTRDAILEAPSKRLRLSEDDERLAALEEDSRMYEYTSAANPNMPQIPVRGHDASLHESGPTRIIPFDLSREMQIDYPASSPNLLAAFIRINPNESIDSEASATSQAFYVIRGTGHSVVEGEEIAWGQGDLFVIPATETSIRHFASADSALYWVHDQPLLTYLGVKPCLKKFRPTLFRRERLLAEVERIRHQPGAEHRNRLGILLGNKITEDDTKTLTHTLWSLLNMLPPGDAQRPHRHNSVALDLCVLAEPGDKVYTLMGPELDEHGWVKNPVKCVWKTGSVFSTPPGWWHSHHNETDQPAWVLPMQDAGLYTYQRTLDIRFSEEPNTVKTSKDSRF
jgi:gentisate 1,2-dioxygenase